MKGWIVLGLVLGGFVVPCRAQHERTRQALEAINPAAVEDAVADMRRRWPDHTFALPAQLATRRAAALERLRQQPDAAAVAVATGLISEVRAALLALPALQDARFLLIKRNLADLALPNNWDNVRGVRKHLTNEIVIATFKRGEPQVQPCIRPRRPTDYLGELSLHWDARRLLFSSQNEQGLMRVYEVDLAQPDRFIERAQIPDLDVDNLAGCWLADDATLFLSTATMIGVPCVRGSSHIYHLYREDASGIRRLTFDQEHNWYPRMLPDGRVLYLRWEYSDIPHYVARILFTMNPDGSGQREFYGSNSYWPNAIFYAKPIPDEPHRVVGVVSGHHGLARMGELILFDPSKGRFETSGVVQRIPGHGKPVEAKILDHLVDQSWPRYLQPEPLGGAYFVVPMQRDAQSQWGLYLVDLFDNATLLLEEPGVAFLEPTVLAVKPRPPVLPSQLAQGKPGYLKIVDIYGGPGLAGVPRGTIRSLRVATYAYSYRGMGGQVDRVGLDGPWDVRRILGTVPVAADGSAFFEVPPNTPIMIQPLDENGRAVQLMRSWVMSMPGEVQTCVGCHEPLNSSTPAHRIDAMNRPPDKIRPWYGPTRGFSFNREVQPVLDKYCVRCHDGSESNCPDFSQRPDAQKQGRDSYYQAAHFPPAYLALKQYVRNHTMESDMHLLMPYEFHASTTELVKLLEGGHQNVVLDVESWDRINTWIDLNTPAHGTWSEISGTNRTAQVAARRRELLKRYAGIDEDVEDSVWRSTFTPSHLIAPPRAATRKQQVAGAPAALPLRIAVAPTEVTNREYREFDPQHDSGIEVGDFLQFSERDRGFPMTADEQPVVRVSQQQATAYCAWLSTKSGRKYRLPTLAERRAFAQQSLGVSANLADRCFRDVQRYAPWALPSGAVLPWRWADTNRVDGYRVSAPVKQFPASVDGLYDVIGNVWEWTSECDEEGRALAMGGSFATHPRQVTASLCVSYQPWQRVYDVGFRVVEEK